MQRKWIPGFFDGFMLVVGMAACGPGAEPTLCSPRSPTEVGLNSVRRPSPNKLHGLASNR
jgi:hypothetical protein